MLSCTVVEYGPVFMLNQDFRVLAAQPDGWGGGGGTHDNLQLILGGKGYGFVQPGKVVFPLFRFQLRPGKFGKVGELESQFVHLFEVPFPLVFVPMLGIVVSACQGKRLVVEPCRLGKERSGHQTSKKQSDNLFSHGCFFLMDLYMQRYAVCKEKPMENSTNNCKIGLF